ncbi:uncharacterized protein LOC135056899 isoform X2 [Pseudophryne corroboree]
MESIIKVEPEPEGDSMSLQRTLQSTCQGPKPGGHYEAPMETKAELPGDLQHQIMTSDNSASPGNREMSGQGSPDPAPSYANTDQQPEVVNVPIETVTQDRHADSDKRHLSKEEKVRDTKEPGCQETSSDEWETASEDSAAFEENVDITVGNANGTQQCDRKRHSTDQGKTDGPLQKEISRENIDSKETFSEIRPCDTKASGEEAPGSEAISKESGPHGKDTIGEEAGPHCKDTAHEESGPHGKETVHVEAGPHSTETASKGSGPHGNEIIGEEPRPHGNETVSEKLVSHGNETIGDEPRPHGNETISEKLVSHNNETVGEEPRPHGNKTVSEEPGPYGEETVGEEPGLHGKETIGEEPGPHGKETVSEETGSQGKDTVRQETEETQPDHSDTVGDELHADHRETVAEGTQCDHRETVANEVHADHRETVAEGTQSDLRDMVAEEPQTDCNETVAVEAQADCNETVAVEAQADCNETVAVEAQADCNETVAVEAQADRNETVAVEAQADCNETVAVEAQADHKEAVAEEAQADHKEAVAVEAQADHKEAVAEEAQADHKDTKEMIANHRAKDTEIEQTDCRVTVDEEIQADHRESDHRETVTQETPADHRETFTQETPADHRETVTQETQADYKVTDAKEASVNIIETGAEETQADHRETTPEDTLAVLRASAAEGRKTVAEDTQAEGRETVTGDIQNDRRENVTEINVQEIYKPEGKETHEGKGELQNEDIIFIDGIIIEPSSEDRVIVNKSTKETCNEEEASENPSGHSSETPEMTDVNNSDPVKETSDGKGPSGTIETTSIESEKQLENRGGTKACEKTKLETSQGLSGVLLMMANHGLTLDEEDSYKDYETDKGFQEATSGLFLFGALINDEEGQTDKVICFDDIATNENSIVLSESEYVRSKDLPGESSDTLHQNEILILHEQVEHDVHSTLAYSQDFNEPNLQQIDSTCIEQSTNIKDPSSFQKHIADDPEPRQEDLQATDIVVTLNRPSSSYLGENPQELDEPDCYSKDLYPSMTFKDLKNEDGSIAKLLSLDTAQSSSMENTRTSIGDGELTTEQESSESLLTELPAVTSSKDRSFSPGHPMIAHDQDTMASDPVIGIEAAESSQIYKTDNFPSPNHWGIASTLQGDPYYEVSSGGRLQSDLFTTSLTAISPQTFTTDETVDPKRDSSFNPISDGNVSSTSIEEEASKRKYTFFPTQIFNPILLLSGSPEGSGFYQDETLVPTKGEETYHSHLRPPPHENQVPLRGSQFDNITGKYDSSPINPEETSNTNPSMAHPAAPLWLPPRRSRHLEDSGGAKQFKAIRTPENPLVRRATIRHKRNSQAGDKRFSVMNLPGIPQHGHLEEPRSQLQKNAQLAGTNAQMALQNRQLPRQQNISEDKQEIAQPRNRASMDRLTEEDESAEQKTSRHPESVILRTKRAQVPPPSSDSSYSIRRRYSTLINSSNLLYQEYSDVALNQEIQRQKPGHSPAEEKDPGSPRLRRRILSSQDSYLQRLSISSADSLWQDIPKIRDSSIFLSMTREEQKLQEAKFELIMSEALYLRSLNIAVDHFQRSPELQEVVGAQDRQWLFSRLSEVRDASSDFLFDLEEEFESNMYNFQVCDVVISHEQDFRRVYLPYVTNQSYQDRTFQRLMSDNPKFQQVLAKLESDPVCQRLSLKSFLILPFQRITRLRLLLQNILKRSAPGSTEETQATEAHNALEKLIRDCNESVQRMKDTEELILLNQKIQFECKIFPLISQSRRLVKHGEVTSLEFNSLSFKWKVTSRPVYLHLFNDCLLLSRVREGGRFVVFDHSSEFRVERCEIKLHSNQKNIFRVFLRDSAAGAAQDVRETEYIFRTETQSQKLRWISALSPPKEEIDFMRDHGLSQMQCLKSYKSRENDELSLEKADILMVTQNSDDGWLHGLRLADLQSGWFPMSHVQPISRNACIRNLQEEKRLQSARAKLHPK